MTKAYWANAQTSVTFSVRLPKLLRNRLQEQARAANVSLNRFIVDLLEKSPGVLRAMEPKEWKCCICNYRYCKPQADDANCLNCGNKTIEPVLFA